MRFNNTFLNNQQVTEETKREIKKFSRNKWQQEHNSKPMGCGKSSSKKEGYSNTILPRDTRKTSTRQPNFTPKTIWKKKKNNNKIAEGKES